MADEISDKAKEKNKQRKKELKIKADLMIKTDSLLRETSSHYIRLIGDADRKARIMLIVTSVLITIGATILSGGIHVVSLSWISSVLLIFANILTLFFAIFSVKPELKTSHMAKETENNILHYKKCSEYSLRTYTELMIETLEDNEKKRDAIIKELYYYGNLLKMKYKYLDLAYRSFLWGMVVSIMSYLIILLIRNIVE